MSTPNEPTDTPADVTLELKQFDETLYRPTDTPADVTLELKQFDETLYRLFGVPQDVFAGKTKDQMIDELRSEQTRLYQDVGRAMFAINELKKSLLLAENRVAELNRQLLDSEKDRNALLDMLKDLGDDGDELVRQTERERLAALLEQEAEKTVSVAITQYCRLRDLADNRVRQGPPTPVRLLFARVKALEGALGNLLEMLRTEVNAYEPYYQTVVQASKVLRDKLF